MPQRSRPDSSPSGGAGECRHQGPLDVAAARVCARRAFLASGGRLRICELSPTVRAVFRTSNLDRLFAIDRDRREALEAF